jgi:hypothetical protein
MPSNLLEVGMIELVWEVGSSDTPTLFAGVRVFHKQGVDSYYKMRRLQHTNKVLFLNSKVCLCFSINLNGIIGCDIEILLIF